MYNSNSLSRRPWGIPQRSEQARDHSICKSSERSVTVPFLRRLVLSSYAIRTKSSTLGMRLPFVLVADGLCPAFRRLNELWTTLRRPMPWDCRAEFESGRFVDSRLVFFFNVVPLPGHQVSNSRYPSSHPTPEGLFGSPAIP